MAMKCDFSGWATKNDLECSDGRIIRRNAFKVNDGQTVPLVWNHQHNEVYNVLGHAVLENRDDGVWAYCYFNDTDSGKYARQMVEHGDVNQLSIYANQLKQKGKDVIHGVIREVSLVLSGANPGAYIMDVSVAHGEDADGEGIIFTGITSDDYSIEHSSEEEPMEKEYDERTIGDVLDTLNDEQRDVVMSLLNDALELSDEDEEYDDYEDDRDEDDEDYDDDGNYEYDEYDEGEYDDMKHNAFDNSDSMMGVDEITTLSHSDMETIFKNAKQSGSLKDAVNEYLGEDSLIHSVDTTGMTVATGTQTYGFNDASMLFPEYKNLNNPPEWISRDMDWVQDVMSNVHKTPFSRIKSTYANITEDDARAKGYFKGNLKKEEVFTTLKRTTDPQTIYKKQKLDRDDILDITDFDVVSWIKKEMEVMLDEEKARAILIGDGRNPSSDDKIQELHVRPIATDVPLFNTKVNVTKTQAMTPGEFAKATIDAILRARKNYKGSGNPTFYTTEDVLTEMLLVEDQIGHKLYKTEAELATALRVKKIVTVEVMEGQQVDNKPLIGIIVNLKDYNVGADKGGEKTLFDDFDIDYNQYKYLIECRMSGALVKPYSALTILEAAGA